jgi:hypothetical protein
MLWVPYYLLLLIGVYKFYHSLLSPLHSEHSHKSRTKELTHRRVVYYVRDTERVHTCSSRNCNIPSMRWANTDIAPNKPVTLHRNQLLTSYGVTIRVHCHVTVLRYAVTLQLCTHPKRVDIFL